MDSPMAEATSVLKRGSLSPLLSSTAKRLKLDQDELTSLYVKLNETADKKNWLEQLHDASKYPREMIATLTWILTSIIDALAGTMAEDDYISPLDIRRFVEDFTPDERREWEDGIKACIQRRDWTDLITHRSSTTTLQDVFFLTMATARLQKPVATLNVAHASSETMYVSKRFCR